MAGANDKPDPAKCGATTRRGTYCEQPAGHGTDHAGYGPCSKHGGHMPGPRRSADLAMTNAELIRMGLQLDIEPTEAMLVCVRTAAGWLAYISARVAEVDEAAVLEDSPQGKVVNIWIRLQAEAIDRLSRVSEAALRQGVAERRVQMAERAGHQIAQAIEDSLAELDLPANQRAKFGRAVATRLAVLEMGDPDDLEGTARAS